jgi:hypothetical protein
MRPSARRRARADRPGAPARRVSRVVTSMATVKVQASRAAYPSQGGPVLLAAMALNAACTRSCQPGVSSYASTARPAALISGR